MEQFIEEETNKLAISDQEDEKKKKKKTGGFMKPVQLSSALADFMGCNNAARTDVTREIWKYIKEHNLQNPDDRREIICDEKLLTVIKRPKIHFMKMSKVLCDVSKYCSPLCVHVLM